MLLVRFVEYFYGKWNALRLHAVRTYLRLKGVQLGKDVYIARGVLFKIGRNARLSIGDGVAIQENCHIVVSAGSSLSIGDHTFLMHDCEIASAANTEIGRYCSFAPHCMIIDSDHVYSDPSTPIRFQGGIYSKIKIDDEVWLGAKSIVLKGVTIGRHSVAGAGSIINSDVPAYSVVVGMPAKVVKRIEAGTHAN